MSLKNWALIDIETTGIDPTYDEIIDVGFLSFEGTKLTKKFSSLVRTENELSQFIQKLTGIKPVQIKNAPTWDNVKNEVLELDQHVLIAHNANFESQFLSREFEVLTGETPAYADSILYLALLNPGRSQMNLDSFIRDWNVREEEAHRGFEDSLDLLKVFLLPPHHTHLQPETYKTHLDAGWRNKIKSEIDKFSSHDFWFRDFFHLEVEDLNEIAEQIDFALVEAYDKKIQIAEDISTSHVLNKDVDFSGESIAALLQDEKGIQEVLPGYRYRESQEKLAKRVGQAFQNSIHALIQAPTGTGKTLGYLLPSALYSSSTKNKVLISTGTKTLQNQAQKKDIPILKKILGKAARDLSITKLVGSKNHFCELLFRQDDGPDLLQTFEKQFARSFFELLFYLNSVAENNEKRITTEETPYVLKRINSEYAHLSEDIAVDFRACSGNKCPFKGQCSYLQGLREAKESDIIIGNHALTLSWPKSFPRPSHIIIDEAHKLENEATKAFEKQASQKELELLANNLIQLNGVGALFYLLSAELKDKATSIIAGLRKASIEAGNELSEHFVPLASQIEIFFKRSPRYNSIYWNELPMVDNKTGKDNVSISVYNHFDSVRHIISSLHQEILPYAIRWENNQFKEENDVVAWSRFESFFAHLDDLKISLDLSLSDTEEYSRSLSFHEKEGYLIKSSPINMGKLISEQILKTSESVIFTSATLADGMGQYGITGAEWMTGYLYVESEKRFQHGLYLPPVYDYQNNAKVYLVDDVPALYEKNFVPDVLAKVMPLIKEIGGRTLLLFSARNRFEIAREILLKEFEGKIPLFIQGMGQNIVEDFKQVESGILLGMESFGEGIDIPGEQLQFLFIDKIPDLRMDFVIQKRRDFFEKSFGDEFNQYFMAYRARLLQQKLGRLLRSENDKGVAIVVDSRVKRWKGNTRKTFQNLLRPYDLQQMKFSECIEKSRAFFNVL